MRKVLSFVLVLALVLSSFSMAFAADSTATGLADIAGNANEDAIQVAYDLGIVTGNPDGTFTPDKAVNRAEFAAMLTRALDIPDSALAGYTTTSFKDTAGYTWAVPYLAFCQSKGIMLGDGAGNVMPGRTITVNEAMTMALRAVGYTANSSLLVGVWPSNYVSIAQNNDLYDDVAKDTTVNKASAAQIIYNLLTVQKVAVNTDGTTDYLWDGDKDDEIEANLLNTNLGCTAFKDEILGSNGFGYDDSIINITKNLGAYGDAYLNSDDEVVAFTKDSVALTGKLNDKLTKFEVGDVEYNIDNDDNEFTTDGAYFANGDYKKDSNGKITVEEIASYALANADDEETVTLNVDLSGKTIKDIYSVAAWKATDWDQVGSDVQEDIADAELLDGEFNQDDDDAIDTKSFELVGAATLEKIAEDDVVYIYESTDDDVIRKVAVGTETVEGVVDEIDDDGTLTIGGKDYDLAPALTCQVKIGDFDTDSDGTFFLDANGEIYDFDGSNTVNTYGIIKAKDTTSTIDNYRVKLYTSEDATTTFDFAEAIDDMDWTSEAAATSGAIVEGNLIGYSVDSNGDIDEVDNTAKFYSAANVNIDSTKVLSVTGVGKLSIEKDAVVFTYDGTAYDDPQDVGTRDDLETGAAEGRVYVLLNDDGNVKALYVDSRDASPEDDAIYGVINTRKTGKNSDGDAAYKYTGFIDNAAFTYATDDDTAALKVSAGTFSVYAFTLDSSDNITKIESMIDDAMKYVAGSEKSGWIVRNFTIDKINGDKNVISNDAGTIKYSIDDDAVVYKYDADNDEFTAESLKKLKEDYIVTLIDAKGDDADGNASIVIYQED